MARPLMAGRGLADGRRRRRPAAGMRIALVLGTSTGGIGAHVRSLVEALAAGGLEVVVLAPAQAERLFALAAAGGRVTPIEIPARLAPVPAARAVGRLRRALRGSPDRRRGRPAGTASDIDVVHAHGLRAGLLAGLALAERPRPPLVVTWHNAVLGGFAVRTAYRPLERFVARRADVTLGASADLVARARALGARDVRLAPVAAPPLPPARRPPAAVRAALAAGDRPLVLAVGRLHPQKAFDVLIAAASRWRHRVPPPLVAIAGDGPERARLERAIVDAGAPARLLGRRNDVADLLGAADVVVLSSVWEARPLAAQEALRAGRPLVATAVGGVPELVGNAAVLVPPGDPVALAGAVASLLDDPARAAALAQAGPRQAAQWPDERAMVGQLLEIYREVRG